MDDLGFILGQTVVEVAAITDGQTADAIRLIGQAIELRDGVAAYHFNRVTPYGLLANLAAVPAMGLMIAPAAIAAGVLAPLGLETPALWLMGEGIEWVLDVAHWVAALPGAVRPVPAAPAAVTRPAVPPPITTML